MLAGNLPAASRAIAFLTQLELLDLSYNSFAPAPLPASVARLQRLRTLDLSGTGATGPLPADWALPALTSLALRGNQLAQTLPQAWATGLPALQRLDLSHNQLEGQLPSQWSALQSLRELSLADNQLQVRREGGRGMIAWLTTA